MEGVIRELERRLQQLESGPVSVAGWWWRRWWWGQRTSSVSLPAPNCIAIYNSSGIHRIDTRVRTRPRTNPMCVGAHKQYNNMRFTA